MAITPSCLAQKLGRPTHNGSIIQPQALQHVEFCSMTFAYCLRLGYHGAIIPQVKEPALNDLQAPFLL